jgi:hypothetical protein
MLKMLAFDLFSKYENLLRIIALFIVSYLCLDFIFGKPEKAPYITGDGFEYILMTEAYYNHSSPDIQFSDVLSFKEKYSKHYNWNEFYKRGVIDDLLVFLALSKNQFMENNGWLYSNKSGKFHSYHFSFYSLINLPCYSIFKSKGPVIPFWITNFILIILTCLVLLFLAPFSSALRFFSALCFAFSSMYWYLKWEHAEILTGALVTVGMVFYFRKDYYLAVFFLGLSCLQTQPLTILVGFVSLETLISRGMTLKNILFIISLGSIALLPQLFYFINFETTNLVKDAGYLDSQYITFNRVTGFFFDLNTGVILAIPIILLTYLALYVRQWKLVLQKVSGFEWNMLLPFVILAMVMTVSMMVTWNHSMAIINRYAVWISCIILVNAFFWLDKLKTNISLALSALFLVAQIATVFFHQQFNKYDWSNHRHSSLANWALTNYPKWVNPDPLLFGQRTLHTGFDENDSPVILFKQRQVKKIMVHKDKLDDLKNFGVPDETIELIRKKVTFNYGWGYIDAFFETSMNDADIFNLIKERKITEVADQIGDIEGWVEQTKRQAREWNKSYKEALRMNAEYLVNEDEKVQENE